MSQKRRTIADEPFIAVRSNASDLPDGGLIDEHAHDWHQLIYVAGGLMMVRTEAGSWIAPPTWAVWVPAGVRHSIRFVVASTFRTIYMRRDMLEGVPAGCCALAVSPLLRELILRTVALGMLDARDGVEAAITTLIAADLRSVGPPSLTLAEPTSRAMVQAAQLIASDAPEASSMASLARAVGIGARTLERRFRTETGLTPGRWRQQRKLLRGLELIAGGALVKAAAAEAGYTSPSAYVAAFRKAFGATPSRYFVPPAASSPPHAEPL